MKCLKCGKTKLTTFTGFLSERDLDRIVEDVNHERGLDQFPLLFMSCFCKQEKNIKSL